MKKIFFLSVVTLFLVSTCNRSSIVKVNGSYAAAPETQLEISRLNLSRLVAVDSVFTDSKGNFSFRLPAQKGFPEFYYITQEGKPLTSLLLFAGDHITLTIDRNKSVRIIGSVETDYLHEIEDVMRNSQHQYDSLMKQFLQLDPKSTEAVSLNYELGSIYVKQKQGAIRFLFNHPKSFASVLVLFQKFSDELPLFADPKDMLYFQRLYDSLQPLYPRSPYIAALREQSEMKKWQIDMDEKLLNIQELGFPDIIIPDVYAKPMALSSLKGKVILLSFWLSQDPRQRIENQELLELYRKYAVKGLEIYQVALDTDKTSWARTITDQALPWISVCDGYGVKSTAVSTYAVTKVPSRFLINKSGDIVGRDFSLEQLNVELAKLCK